VLRSAAVLTLAILLAACTRVGGDSIAGGRHPWTQPGTLRVATSIGLNTLNPFLSTEQVEAQIQALALDPLIAVDERGRDVPILAAIVPTLENGGIGRDGLTITYHLRHNVRWQDGAPFTSRDVAFSYQAIMNPATTVATRHGYDQIARVDTPDRYTAVFRLKRPFSPAVQTFFAHSDAPYFILPAHLLARYHDLNRVPFNASPVGTGPFKIVRWLRGDRIEFVANDDYFLGKPKLRRIVVSLVPDENTISSQMRAHEVDWFYAATPRMYPQLTTIAGVDVRLVPMNANDSILFNTKRAPYDDPNVRRRSVSRSTSRCWCKRRRSERPLPPPRTYRRSSGVRPEGRHDGARSSARERVARRRRLEARIRRRARKERETVLDGPVVSHDSITDRNRGVLIASMLKDAGIETDLKGYTTSLLYGPAGTGIQADGKFDASLQTWYAGSDPDDSTQLTCDQVAPKGYNWTRYCSAAMDAAQRVALSHYDRPTRKRAYATIEELLARDTPYVYLWWPRQIEAINSDLKGFRPNGIIEDWNAYQWSI